MPTTGCGWQTPATARRLTAGSERSGASHAGWPALGAVGQGGSNHGCVASTAIQAAATPSSRNNVTSRITSLRAKALYETVEVNLLLSVDRSRRRERRRARSVAAFAAERC